MDLSLLSNVWTVVEPLLAVGTAALVVKTWYQTRKARVKLSNGVKGTPVVLNLTGHPISSFQDDWGRDVEQVQVACTVPVNDGQEVVEKYFRDLISDLPSDIRSRVMAGDSSIVWAIPNMCSGEFLAVLHGMSGQFPKITRSFRTKEGTFVWLKPRDLQSLRLETRFVVRGGGEK